MFEYLLVALDGSNTSNAGLKTALELARANGGKIIGLHVIDNRGILINIQDGQLPAKYFDKLYAAMRTRGQTVLAKAETAARKAGVQMTPLLTDCGRKMVAQAIVDQAQRTKADMIAMGTHGRRGLARAVMGSTAEEVLRESKVPVLLVRSPRPHKRKTTPLPEAASFPKTSRSRAPVRRRAPGASA